MIPVLKKSFAINPEIKLMGPFLGLHQVDGGLIGIYREVPYWQEYESVYAQYLVKYIFKQWTLEDKKSMPYYTQMNHFTRTITHAVDAFSGAAGTLL